MNSQLKPAAAEAIGTFFLVLVGTGAIVVNDTYGGIVTHLGISVAFGGIVFGMIMIFAGISGAHINPAVTLGFAANRDIGASRTSWFLIAQFLGATAASGILNVVFPTHENLGATLPSGAPWVSFVLEIGLTAILMMVILRVGNFPRWIAAGAIGGTVGLEAFFAGPICGASMNPARSFGPAIVSGETGHLWLYLVAPILGAWLAVFINRSLKSGPSGGDSEGVESAKSEQ